jgi:enolase
MKLKEVKAKVVKDSRGEKTISVIVNNCETIAPSGKSTGKYEKPCYKKSIEEDIDLINSYRFEHEINEFESLIDIEKALAHKIGANTLFALEASMLKALAKYEGKELWQVLNPKLDLKKAKLPRILSNTIGGGVHSNNSLHPDFQEFLVSSDNNPINSKDINDEIYLEAKNILKNLEQREIEKNDENALQTSLENERVLEVMKDFQEDISDERVTKINIGVDCAASQIYKNGKYIYSNPKQILTPQQQIEYIAGLIKKYKLFYVEDPLDEEDFGGFSELLKKTKGDCLIVGDDLTVTNLDRLHQAIINKSINGIIVKPNQTGSLLEVHKVIKLARKNNISVIVSHRSGETRDNTIADLAFAWDADFVKTPVIGKERIAKVDRLIEIEKSLKSMSSNF